MDPWKKKVALFAVTFTAIATTCWLGFRGEGDVVARPGLLRRAPHAAPVTPVMANGRKPAGDPDTVTAVQRRPRGANGKPLDRKHRRRGDRRIKPKQVSPQS